MTAAAPPHRALRPVADVIQSEHEALAVADRLAVEFGAGAAERDAQRRLPRAEIERLSDSGLLAITVPRQFGGAEVSARVLAEVMRRLAAADPSIAQIPQSHFVYINVLKQQGNREQQAFFFAEVLAGRRLGNAQSEARTKHAQDIRTTLEPVAGGDYVLNGLKHYATGALFADWITVLARGTDGELYVAYVPAAVPGLEVVDDWDGMGQRVTASGTVRLDGVPVEAGHVVAHHLTFRGPQLHGAQAQLLHTAIDAGIAAGALAEAVTFVHERSRPWFEAEVEHAHEDPLLIQRFGELALVVRGAEALLAEAADAVDEGLLELTDERAAAASIAVAVAKVAADRAANEVSSALFEVSGTRSSLASLNLNRHWRNARTHTLHDPVRWKLHHIGRYVLNGTPPPRHGQL